MGCSPRNIPSGKRREKRQAGQGGPGFCDTCSVPTSTNDENEFLYYYMSLSEDTRKTIGHQFEESVLECTFRGRECLEKP
jgi:hypothetical protein